MRITTLCFLLLVMLTGCGSSDDDHNPHDWTDHTSSTTIVYDLELADPRDMLAVFTVDTTRAYWNGEPSYSAVDVTITSKSLYVTSYNFIVSSSGFRFQNAVVNLQPGQTVTFYDIPASFRTYSSPWITVGPVTYALVPQIG